MPLKKTLRAAGPAALLVIASPALAEDGTSPRNWAPRATAADVPVVVRPVPVTTGQAAADDTFASNLSFIEGLTRPAGPASAPGTATAPADPFGTGPAAAPPAAAAPATPFRLDGSAPADGAADTAADTAEEEEVDLSALRYYAAQNNIARVAAEIRRLKALHPGWEVPQTLFQRDATVDEQPMWDLYAEGRLEAIYAMIRRQRQVTPDYVPSDELVEKLKIAEARRAIAAAADRGRWGAAVEAARAVPDILVCPEMQTLWHMGEALARTGARDRAVDLYSYILTTCPDPKERFATLQKASAVLPLGELDALLALAGPDVGTREDLNRIRLDKLRGIVGEATAQPDGPDPAPQHLAALAEAALAGANADDAALLGWYHYSRNAYGEAGEWFDRSLQMAFTVKALEGYILALRQAGKVEEAREVALQYHVEDAAIAKLFIEIASTEMTDEDPAPLSAGKLETFTSVVEAHRSALGAQSLGWYLYNEGEHEEALDWFEKSMAWEPTAEGALGLAIALNRTGDPQGARELATQYGEEFPTLTAFVETIGVPRPRPSAAARTASRSEPRQSRPRRTARASGNGGLVREAVKAYESGDYDTALRKLEANRARGGETRDLALLRGWALHNSGKHRQAHRLFTDLNQRQPSKKALEGTVHTWRQLMPPRFH